MKTFTDNEHKLILKLKGMPPQTPLETKTPCLNHSFCLPLPLFRILRTDEDAFEAEWNEHHRKGPRQTFLFSNVT
jgi:hypothetical protein